MLIPVAGWSFPGPELGRVSRGSYVMNRNTCRMTRKGSYDSASDRACSGMLTCRLLTGPKLNQSGAQAPIVDIENLLEFTI